MITIVGVRFKKVGKIYYFTPNNVKFEINDPVIVETSRGVECGFIALTNREIEKKDAILPLKPIIRKATPQDLEKVKEYENMDPELERIFNEKVKRNRLKMNFVDAEFMFDGSKLVFYFTADGRVDFRELVRDLASIFKIRIELRQIGVRDEAREIGGYGICGRPLCCASHLSTLGQVSVRMARDQGVSLTPSKISGSCGRLLCCFNYEQQVYEDLLKTIPMVGSIVKTKIGRGTVISTSILEGKVEVRFDNPKIEVKQQEFNAKDVELIKKPRYLSDGEADPNSLKNLEGE